MKIANLTIPVSRLLIPAILFVATFLAFVHAGSHGLNMCDDFYYVTMQPAISNGLSLDGILFAFTDVSQGIWMPLTYISYMVDRSLGWGCGGLHLQSVFWHALNAVLLYHLLHKLCGNRFAALVSALFWAVHPLRVESVVWIASRKDLLSTFFFLAALIVWTQAHRGMFKLLNLSFALFLVGAMAKPSVMVFPAFAILIDCFVTHRRKSMDAYVQIVIASVTLALFAGWAQKMGGATVATASIPFWYRILNAAAAHTIYLGNLIWPTDLAMQCAIRYPAMPRISIIGLLAVIMSCLCLFWLIFPRLKSSIIRRNVDPMFDGTPFANSVVAGLGIYFLAFVPFLGIAGFGNHAFADRFTILPTIGISLLLAQALSRSAMLAALACFTIPVLIIQTQRQMSFWKDDITLFEHTLEVDGERNPDVQHALGICYWEQEYDMEKTYLHLRKSLDFASPQQRDRMTQGCEFLMDACFATGRDAEADDLYFWMRKIDMETFGSDGSCGFLMAEALWLLHSKDPQKKDKVEKIIQTLHERMPASYYEAYVAYKLALQEKDEQLIKKALHGCMSVDSYGGYCRCRWAHDNFSR